jgi:Cof subfamily protein (haloacid dehalogenase superfamily)
MKLYVFDVDGTLIHSSRLRKRTISNLNKILDCGDAIAIASGRPYIGIKKYLDLLHDGKKFAIAANGAGTYDYSGNVLDSVSLRYKDFVEFNNKYEKEVKKYKGSIYSYTIDKVGYFYKTTNTVNESICNNNIPLQDFKKEPLNENDVILKIMVAMHKKDFEEVGFEEEKKKFHFVDSSEIYHEFVNKDTDKVRGVKTLVKLLNIKDEDCYCFGDEMNDYEMIKTYNGVAMGNAVPKVKEVAKIITKNVKEDGVSYALEDLIK